MNPADWLNELNSFYQKAQRVLTVSYRPSEKEFWAMAKTTGLGMALIGLIGFIITLVFTFI